MSRWLGPDPIDAWALDVELPGTQAAVEIWTSGVAGDFALLRRPGEEGLKRFVALDADRVEAKSAK